MNNLILYFFNSDIILINFSFKKEGKHLSSTFMLSAYLTIILNSCSLTNNQKNYNSLATYASIYRPTAKALNISIQFVRRADVSLSSTRIYGLTLKDKKYTSQYLIFKRYECFPKQIFYRFFPF